MALTLAAVETAIEGLISGSQSETIDGISFTKASLSGLWDMRTRLKDEATRATRPTMRGFNLGTMGYGDASGTDGDVTKTSLVG